MLIYLNFVILQYNTIKLKNKIMTSLLQNFIIWNYNVLIIQKSWHNKYNNNIYHFYKN